MMQLKVYKCYLIVMPSKKFLDKIPAQDLDQLAQDLDQLAQDLAQLAQDLPKILPKVPRLCRPISGQDLGQDLTQDMARSQSPGKNLAQELFSGMHTCMHRHQIIKLYRHSMNWDCTQVSQF